MYVSHICILIVTDNVAFIDFSFFKATFQRFGLIAVAEFLAGERIKPQDFLTSQGNLT